MPSCLIPCMKIDINRIKKLKKRKTMSCQNQIFTLTEKERVHRGSRGACSKLVCTQWLSGKSKRLVCLQCIFVIQFFGYMMISKVINILDFA